MATAENQDTAGTLQRPVGRKRARLPERQTGSELRRYLRAYQDPIWTLPDGVTEIAPFITRDS